MTIPNDVIAELKAVVGEGRWVCDPEKIRPYVEEWRGNIVGKTPLVVEPASTLEVAQLVRICAASETPIVAQGGNTGMCAGAVPSADGSQVVLSLARLNTIREVDANNFSMEVEAGCVLAAVRSAAEAVDRHFAISLGSADSCQIGGNLSTNAGGLNVLRYGTAREQVLGLEVVLADGTIINGLRSLRKDTAGYDLKQLFIGSEGTLGIITAASLKLHPSPGPTQTAIAALRSGEKAIGLLAMMRSELRDVFEAFELISGAVMTLLAESGTGARPPFDANHDWYVLMEVAADDDALAAALSKAVRAGLVDDAIIAKNVAEADALWRMRHSISAAEKRKGEALKHDISVPVSRLAEFLTEGDTLLAKIAPRHTLFAFGHVGDGNLHYNVVLEAETPSPERITPAIYALVQSFGGSISAEHGIGSVKRDALAAFRSPAELNLMKTLKRSLDPNNILNPGKVI